MSDVAANSPSARAHAAAARGDWQVAFDLFQEADAHGQLGIADLPVLADAAYGSGHLDATIDTWERTYAKLSTAGESIGAAGAAVRVAMHLLFDTALMAPVRGWLNRAEQLLDDDGETPVHAWFAAVRSYERMLSGDPEGARPWARRAIELGSTYDAAAAAIGRIAEARLLILDGDVDRGLALLDEAGTAATSGGLDPLPTGVVYCELVCALQGLAQYDLAEEWTEAMERWADAHAIGSLRGRCRVHRAEILRLRGLCHEAEAEALRACDELRPYLRRELGWPLSELGRIRLHRGDVAAAEQAFLAAHQAGWDPQPGLARVLLAQGAIADAEASITDAFDNPSSVPSKERPPSTDLQRAPCSMPKSRSPSPPATLKGGRRLRRARHGRLPLPRARHWSPARRKAEHACISPPATPAMPNRCSRRPSDCGTKWEHHTKPRSPASASPIRTAPSGPTNVPTSKSMPRCHPRSDHDRR